MGRSGRFSAPISCSMKERMSATASLAKFTESVLMSVIRPVEPEPTSIPSYSCCAVRMVLAVLIDSLRTASCCMVEVVKGALGRRERLRLDTAETVAVSLLIESTIAWAALWSGMSNCSSFLPSLRVSAASKATPCLALSR